MMQRDTFLPPRLPKVAGGPSAHRGGIKCGSPPFPRLADLFARLRWFPANRGTLTQTEEGPTLCVVVQIANCPDYTHFAALFRISMPAETELD